MRLFGQVNNISSELKGKLKQLKHGEFAKIKTLDISRVHDPETGKTTTIYPHRQFYVKDTIFDQYANDGNGAMVDIGVVAPGGYDVKNSLVTMYEKFEFDDAKAGFRILVGSVALDRELYEFFQLSNLTKDNEILGDNRDISVDPILEIVDNKKETVKKNKMYSLKKEAFTMVATMDAADIRDFAASMNWDNYNGDLEDLRASMGAMADTDPEGFNAKATDPLRKTKAIIRKAVGSLINYDAATHSVKWINGTTLAQLEHKDGQDWLTGFANWIQAVANGQKILDQLRKAKAGVVVPA